MSKLFFMKTVLLLFKRYFIPPPDGGGAGGGEKREDGLLVDRVNGLRLVVLIEKITLFVYHPHLASPVRGRNWRCGMAASARQSGSTLLMAVVLGSIIISMGINLVGVFAKELSFAEDFVLSERAYFAAESGVELALLALREEPLDNVEGYVFGFSEDEGMAELDLSVGNKLGEMSFVLRPYENVKFRLQVDDEVGVREDDLRSVESWDMRVWAVDSASVVSVGDNVWRWRILCEKDGRTLSLESEERVVGNFQSFRDFVGVMNGVDVDPDDNNRMVSAFWNEEDSGACFLSLTNLHASESLRFEFEADDGMSPPRTEIVSRGRAGGREKVVRFLYSQKNLRPEFGFLLLHVE